MRNNLGSFLSYIFIYPAKKAFRIDYWKLFMVLMVPVSRNILEVYVIRWALCVVYVI